MTTPITLLLGVHAHQPVGNFPAVIDEAHQRCYRPFLEALHEFPEFRFSAHFSGWLLDYLLEKFPDDMALLERMAARGQIEMFGAGDCEPVLAAIRHRDRLSQIAVMSDKLARRFGRKPSGAWLTERVWEATVVPALADSDIRYVVVDDYHFLCTGLRAENLDGYYTTEEDGRVLDAFPISEELRYRLPFAPAEDAVAYLEHLADSGHAAAVYFDDIEKFGIWPDTYEWVYEKRWLDKFIRGVLASPKIRTATYQDFHARHATRGIVYLPSASYVEMNEWTLPPWAAGNYSRLVRQEKRSGAYGRTKAHVRGGIWRNFFSRYAESNWMHKRMLGLSDRLAAAPRGEALRELLHRSQANDAYWHGLFGGLYLPHLRRAVWNNLIELEAALDAQLPRAPLERGDIDHDGHEEILLHNAHLQIALRLDGNGAIHELDSYALRQNFCDTLTRRREHYYSKFDADTEHEQAHAGIISAHDRIVFKHEISAADLFADTKPRAALLDCWQPLAERHCAYVEKYSLTQASAAPRSLELSSPVASGRIVKRIRLEGRKIVVVWSLAGLPAGYFMTRLNLAMPSCDGFSGRYILEDGTIPHGFGEHFVLSNCRELTLDDRALGGGIVVRAAPAASICAAPYHTVSLSEAGFEKIMQAASPTVLWTVAAGPIEIRLELELHNL